MASFQDKLGKSLNQKGMVSWWVCHGWMEVTNLDGIQKILCQLDATGSRIERIVKKDGIVNLETGTSFF